MSDLPRTPPPPVEPAAQKTPATSPAPASTSQSPEDRSTAFRPVQGGDQLQSGEKLLVEAYAAIWVILFAMLLLSWRRQKKIDLRLSQLEGAVAKAREAEEKGRA
jgi:CcmD family protein